jgi:drug/metabolite transporter (DMT)-like permease
MSILLGLAASLCWGIADFIVRYSTRIIGPYRTLFYMQFLGLTAITIYLLASGDLVALLHHTSWQPWAWLLLISIINTCSSLALYRAFTVGIMMIVSPITSAYAAITALLSFLSGEKVSLLHANGMGLVLLGVIFTATVLPTSRRTKHIQEIQSEPTKKCEPAKKRGLPPGIGMALFAALGYGISFWLLGFQVTPHLGGVAPTWVGRLVSPLVLACGAPLLKESLKIPRGRTIWIYLTAISIFDTAAFVFYGLGLVQGQVSVVSVLSSLYGAITVILAFFFLHERLHWNQWCGIIIIFIGVALVNI